MTRNRKMTPERRRRYWRIALASVVLMVVGAMTLPLTGYLYVGLTDAYAQSGGAQESNPRANYWRAVRSGQPGAGAASDTYSSVTGRPMPGSDVAWLNREAESLINGSGQNWRQVRNRVIAVYGGWILFGLVVLMLHFYAIRGRVGLEDGRSGVKVLRWTAWDRFVHWTTAVSFVALSVTGLSLLFGRSILIPLMGPEGFAVWATIAMGLHEFVGPWIFTPGVALMISMWLANNLPEKGDLKWWIDGGGIIGKKHPSSGRLNSGEKIWFWFIATFGVACIVTGVVLAFPIEWAQTRSTMQLSNVIHGVCALLWIAFWVGHAYIGTIGSEGSLEAMTTGYVDVNWAKQHHDLWYDEIADTAEHVTEGPSVGGSTEPTAARA